MPILRFAPGEIALVSGKYSLVGHFGEPKGFADWFEKGERLPFVAAATDEPVWFALTERSAEDVQAA
jgi:hypothetical protein